jgi:hypothetical protein
MPHPRFSNEEIARRGGEIYATRLRDQFEPLYRDRIVVMDIETGEYEIDDDALAASKRALAKHPGAAIYGLRVGSRFMYEFGGSPVRVKQRSPAPCRIGASWLT